MQKGFGKGALGRDFDASVRLPTVSVMSEWLGAKEQLPSKPFLKFREPLVKEGGPHSFTEVVLGSKIWNPQQTFDGVLISLVCTY